MAARSFDYLLQAVTKIVATPDEEAAGRRSDSKPFACKLSIPRLQRQAVPPLPPPF
jgi:hypothetical protein